MCADNFIDKNVYHQNKKPIDVFIDEQDKTKNIFHKNSDIFGCVEINVECLDDFEYFVEYMFRKLGKDVITRVGYKRRCGKRGIDSVVVLWY
jgi:hypothetical protein